MKLFLLTVLLLAGASANQEAAPSDDVTSELSADQSTDASRAVTFVQNHVTAHDDGYGHGPDEVHRHTVATTYHYPDYPYPAHHGYNGGGYVAAPAYGHATGYVPSYGGYGRGNGVHGHGDYGHDGYGQVGYGHGGYGHEGYGHGGYGQAGYGHAGYGHAGYAY